MESRVWPALIESSLGAVQNSSNLCQQFKEKINKREEEEEEDEEVKKKRDYKKSKIIKIRLIDVWNDCLKCSGGGGAWPASLTLSGESLSEVCFVCGVITAMLGALIAVSGIFTRNQVRDFSANLINSLKRE